MRENILAIYTSSQSNLGNCGCWEEEGGGGCEERQGSYVQNVMVRGCHVIIEK